MSFEGCTVKCFVKFLLGTDGYDGQIATGIWQAMGEYALREAKKKAIKTVVGVFGTTPRKGAFQNHAVFPR
jgi:hypothetical protein